MTQRYDAEHAQGYAQDVLTRWCVIAEQRLDHLAELYETGRWRRYHSENVFMENIREAKSAVETWRILARREATLDNREVDWSWLDQPAETSAVTQEPGEVPSAGQLGTAAVHAALASIVLSQEDYAAEAPDDVPDCEGIAPEAGFDEEIASEAGFSDEMVPDNRTFQERYPVLQVAL